LNKQFIIEIKKHDYNKDYTVNIYEGLNYFSPVLRITRPTRWNNCLKQIGLFFQSKKFINVFQKHELETKLGEEK
jgi:hypothetical protein